MEYHSIKWIEDNTATRHTKEVFIKCKVSKIGGEWMIQLNGTGDFDHHLVEDSTILLKKMSEKICGGGHG